MFDDKRFIRNVHRVDGAEIDENSWPATVPAVASVLNNGLELASGVTFLVGENGTGKSTIVEAIAAAYGLGPEGGSIHSTHGTFVSESPLGDWISLVKRAGVRRWGFFLRAETMHGYYTFQTAIGGPDFHSMSHGESFLTIAEDYLTKPGFYCLDEPEAALSFSSTLAMIGVLSELAESGGQVLCATHSPLLASLPGATILETSESGIRQVEWHELDIVINWRTFLDEPRRYLRHIFDDIG